MNGRSSKRDSLFKDKNKNRFKSSQRRSACKGIKIGDSVNTNPQEIADHFSKYFQKLAKSSESPPVTSARSNMTNLESLSFLNLENILDTEVTIEEIEHCIKQ